MRPREGLGFLVADVAVSFQATGSPTGQDDGQVDVIVDVRVSDAATEEKERIVEEGAISLWACFELFEILGKERDEEESSHQEGWRRAMRDPQKTALTKVSFS